MRADRPHTSYKSTKGQGGSVKRESRQNENALHFADIREPVVRQMHGRGVQSAYIAPSNNAKQTRAPSRTFASDVHFDFSGEAEE